MTKTDWTAEEVRNTARQLDGLSRQMLTAFAERIETDESAEAFAWYLLTGHGNGLEFGKKPPVEGVGWKPLFTHPPAQPAQVDCPKCHGTGDISDSDGLYVGQCTACRAIKQPAQEQPGWKWVPVMPTEEMLKAYVIAWTGLCHGYSPGCGHYKFMDGLWRAMLDSSPTPPKEK